MSNGHFFSSRYEDFFGRQSNKGAQKKSSSKKVKFDDRPQVKEIEYQETDDENENENVGTVTTVLIEVYSYGIWNYL